MQSIAMQIHMEGLIVEVGNTVYRLRKAKRWSLQQVSIQTKGLGVFISTAQLSRIENGIVAAHIGQLVTLAKIFGVPLEQLLPAEQSGWFIARSKRLRELAARASQLDNSRSRFQGYQYMISRGYYIPVPMRMSDSSAGDFRGWVYSSLKSYLFRVCHINDAEMAKGADAYAGEGILYVIRGRLELFLWDTIFLQNVTRTILEKGDSVHILSLEKYHAFRAVSSDVKTEALFFYHA
jgi:transcriptional regulator with XRE-family HTH domain